MRGQFIIIGLVLSITILQTFAAPLPQDEEDDGAPAETPQEPPAPSEDEGNTAPAEEGNKPVPEEPPQGPGETPASSDAAEPVQPPPPAPAADPGSSDTIESPAAAVEPKEDQPVGPVKPPSGPPPSILTDPVPDSPENIVAPENEVEPQVQGQGQATPPETVGECGAVCMLAHQAPIILFICIIVCVILLVIILFGCYFMKKLHGKALLTTTSTQVPFPSSGAPVLYNKNKRIMMNPQRSEGEALRLKSLQGPLPRVLRPKTTSTSAGKGDPEDPFDNNECLLSSSGISSLHLLSQELPNLESWKLIQRVQGQQAGKGDLTFTSSSPGPQSDVVEKRTETKTIGSPEGKIITTTTTKVTKSGYTTTSAAGGTFADVEL